MSMSDQNSTPAPNPFELQAEELDGVRVIAISGELDLSTAPQLEEPLEATGGETALLIDFSECEFIDSTGIALIVRAWQRMGGGNGDDGASARFAICCLGNQVRRLLEVSGLDTSLPTYGSRDEALAALRG
jgi:anti-anti-sigma factor